MILNRTKPRVLITCLIFLVTFVFHIQAQTLSEIESHRISLPNGWSLTPVGKILPLGDLPLNIAVSPSKKMTAVTNNGQSDQTIQLIDIDRQVIIDSIEIGKAWLGLTFSANGKYLYASGGNDNMIMRYSIIDRHLAIYDSIMIGKPWPVKISIAGIAMDDSKNRLYAVTKENNSLYVVDILTKKVIGLEVRDTRVCYPPMV
jgi:DNA-binding beta-propeller fold protein YncE